MCKAFVTTDDTGKKLVVLPQIIFRGKRTISWKEVEKYLIRYIGHITEIEKSKDLVYIGKDFTDEYAHSVYTRKLKGGLAKAKANLIQGIPELIEIATDKRWNEDFQKRHKKKAEKGWYRYNSRFALPVMDEGEENIRFNIYQAVLIIRHASDDKLYLYDIQNIKKETSNPFQT